MTYKDNTPNYNTKRNVVNFGDFCDNWDSEKKKLKKTNRSILKNSERQQNVKNVKSEFDTVTRKYTDLSKDEIEDKLNSMEELEGLDEAVEELTDANVANLERFVDDYRKKHTKLETRGVQEGLSLLRRATSIEEAISLVNKRIDKYKSLKKTLVENKVDEKEIINGLNDFLLQIEAK